MIYKITNKLYDDIDNCLSIMRKRILNYGYYEDYDIKNILAFMDDFQKYVYSDCDLDDLRFRFGKGIHNKSDIFYKDIIDRIDAIQLRLKLIMEGYLHTN